MRSIRNGTKMLNLGCVDFLTWLCVFVYQISFSSMRDLRCPTAPDNIAHGILVDCRSKGLQSSDIPILDIPIKDTTSLLLSYNNLSHVSNGTFSRLRNLIRLQIDYSGVNHVEPDAFQNLTNLQNLSLYGNSLDIAEYGVLPSAVFAHTPRLEYLNLGNNTIQHISGNYNIFHHLTELHYLYITSFITLCLGYEFETLEKLERLEVYGGSLATISNNSLEGLQNSSIKHFKLSFTDPTDFGAGVFKYLPENLTSLTLFKVRVGNINLLRALEPLRNRSIQILNFDGVSLPFSINPRIQIDDGLLDYDSLKHLFGIAISSLTWKNSNVMALDLSLHQKSNFDNNIKSIDISGNKLQDYKLYFLIKLLPLKFLEEFRLSHDGLSKHTISFWDETIDNILSIIPQDNNQELEYQSKSHLASLAPRSKRNNSLTTLPSPSTPINYLQEEKGGKDMAQTILLNQRHALEGVNFLPSNSDVPYSTVSKKNGSLFNSPLNASRIGDSFLYMTLPNHLYYASFDTVLRVACIFDFLIFAWPNNVTEVYARYATLPSKVKCLFIGLNNVRLIDITGTTLQEIPESFFDYFPHLQVLVLRQTLEDPEFFLNNGPRLLQNILCLVYLDLSDNGLSVLPKDIFKENRLLRYLCLAKNRFTIIPFQIQLTPVLEILDLRMNAFSGISKEDQVNIDEFITTNGRKNFTLLLKDNNLQCICSNLLFAAWIQRTYTQLDLTENQPCVGENGKNLTIGLFLDGEKMWRICQGQYFLLLSILLVFAMLVLYLVVFLISMYQTYIIGKLKQIFVPEFQRQTRQDFSYDVFIGYADQECTFVRFHLLRYLEGDLKLKAFVHQRDLRQDLLDLGTALKASWRILLVITDAFLAHDMCECIMKTATFFESPSKQDSIVVMVTQDVLYAIPDYVLRVVKDENIIVLPDLLTPFSYEATETLRTRILY